MHVWWRRPKFITWLLDFLDYLIPDGQPCALVLAATTLVVRHLLFCGSLYGHFGCFFSPHNVIVCVQPSLTPYFVHYVPNVPSHDGRVMR